VCEVFYCNFVGCLVLCMWCVGLNGWVVGWVGLNVFVGVLGLCKLVWLGSCLLSLSCVVFEFFVGWRVEFCVVGLVDLVCNFCLLWWVLMVFWIS